MAIDLNFVCKSGSLLGYQHFQNAYVTTDLAQATAMLGEMHGIREFHYTRDFPLSMGGYVDLAMAWAGNVVIEILEGRGNPDSFYQRGLAGTGFAVKFHHFGYLVPDNASWERLGATIEAERRDIVFSGAVPDMLSWIYLDAPELGHYLEYIKPGEAWQASLETLPRF